MGDKVVTEKPREAIDKWASTLAQAIRYRAVKPALASTVPEADEQMAYGVQHSVIAQLSAMGDIAGFKSALTNESARATLGWHSPMSGVLLTGMEHRAGEAVMLQDYRTGVIETEIGLRLGRRIKEPVTAASLPAYLSGALPMIELGDVGFNEPPSPLDLIAANTAASRFIQGAPGPGTGTDTDRVQVSLYRDQHLLHAGLATDAMGSVLTAGAWLVNHCLSRGYDLLPGHLLMTGSLGQIQLMQAGEYRADYGEFGCIEFSVV